MANTLRVEYGTRTVVKGTESQQGSTLSVQQVATSGASLGGGKLVVPAVPAGASDMNYWAKLWAITGNLQIAYGGPAVDASAAAPAPTTRIIKDQYLLIRVVAGNTIDAIDIT